MATLTLRDGRALAYEANGAARTLVFAGAGCGRLLTLPLPDLVTFDRPGLGASTLDPDKSFASVADDVRELVHALGGERIAAVANSQGAPFALACAAAGVLSQLTLISPVDEIAYPDIFDQLPPPLQELIELAAVDTIAAHAVFAGFTADALFEYVMQQYPASDAAVYEAPAFVAMYRAALASGFASGAAGYAQDTVLAMRRWDIAFERIAIPVRLLYGADDVFHSPDQCATLAARIPGCVRTIVDDIGGSLAWSPRLLEYAET